MNERYILPGIYIAYCNYISVMTVIIIIQ